MVDAIARTLTRLPMPLLLAGAFLAAAVRVRRRGFRKRPILRFAERMGALLGVE